MSQPRTEPPLKSHPWKYLVYFTTACSYASFGGLIGAYAMVKKHLSEELGFEEGILGFLDGMSFLGLAVGFLVLFINPVKFPRRDFLASCFARTAFLVLVPLAPYFVKFSLPLLIVSQLGSGFFCAYIVIPYIFIIQYFDAGVENRIAINFWSSISSLGDVFSVLAVSFMINYLQINWKIAFLTNLGLFVVFALLQYFSVEEVDMDEHNQRDQAPAQNTWEQTKKFTREFFGKCENFLWLIDYAFVSSLYYSILMWFPYYFLHLGYEKEASVISVMYPLFTTIGVLVYEYPILLCPSKAHWVIFCMFGINVILFIIMTQLGQEQSDIPRYIILVGLSGLVKGGPYPTITSSEMRLRAKTNRQIYYAMTSGRLAFMILTIVLMVIIGFFMQNNLKSFLYILTISTSINLVLNVSRNLYFGPPGQSEQTIYLTSQEKQSKQQDYLPIDQDNKVNQFHSQ